MGWEDPLRGQVRNHVVGENLADILVHMSDITKGCIDSFVGLSYKLNCFSEVLWTDVFLGSGQQILPDFSEFTKLNGFFFIFLLVEIIPLGKESCINEFPALEIVSLLAYNQYGNVIPKNMEHRTEEQFFSLVSVEVRSILEPQLLPNFQVANHT